MQILKGHKYTFQSSQCHFAGGANTVNYEKKQNRQFKHLSCCGLTDLCWVSTLQDFWDLARNTSVDFLAVHGLKTSGGKSELAVFAVELKLPIIESLGKQQAKLKKYYAGRLKKYSICNPLSVEEAK